MKEVVLSSVKSGGVSGKQQSCPQYRLLLGALQGAQTTPRSVWGCFPGEASVLSCSGVNDHLQLQPFVLKPRLPRLQARAQLSAGPFPAELIITVRDGVFRVPNNRLRDTFCPANSVHAKNIISLLLILRPFFLLKMKQNLLSLYFFEVLAITLAFLTCCKGNII